MEMGRDLRNRNKQKTDRNSHKYKYATILHLQHNYYDRLFQEKYTKSRHSEIPCKGFPRLITKKKTGITCFGKIKDLAPCNTYHFYWRKTITGYVTR